MRFVRGKGVGIGTRVSNALGSVKVDLDGRVGGGL